LGFLREKITPKGVRFSRPKGLERKISENLTRINAVDSRSGLSDEFVAEKLIHLNFISPW